jgi:hypothetical protein
MKRKFYQNFSPAEKKVLKQKVLELQRLRREQINDINATFCAPMRESMVAGQLFLKNEIAIEDYLRVEEATRQHLQATIEFFEKRVQKCK